MFPQTLSLRAHFPPGFGDTGSASTRAGGVCANGKPIVRDESSGHLCPLAGAGISKDYLSPRTIPLGGPYTAAAFAAYHPYLYPGYDVGTRKIAVRETTGPLKAWLHEHRKNPYPTKAEKIMLAIITQMTLTQVSTWFANARRRLKKETGGGQWDGVSDSDTGSHADRPTDSGSPPSHKDGSSLGDHYEDLSDVDDNDDVIPFHLEASSSTHDPHPHLPSPPHHPHPYLFRPDPLPNPPPQTSYPLSLLTPSSSHASDVIVTSASPVTPPQPRENKNDGGDANRPKPRIWSISTMLGLEEKEEEEERHGGREEGGQDQGAANTASSSARTPSTSSPDCSSSNGSSGSAERESHRHQDTHRMDAHRLHRFSDNASRLFGTDCVSASTDFTTDSESITRNSSSSSRDYHESPTDVYRGEKLEYSQHRRSSERVTDIASEQAVDVRSDHSRDCTGNTQRCEEICDHRGNSGEKVVKDVGGKKHADDS
ncbi:hypothetical protein ACOMHN_011868 [Nucella lapillus]